MIWSPGASSAHRASWPRALWSRSRSRSRSLARTWPRSSTAAGWPPAGRCAAHAGNFVDRAQGGTTELIFYGGAFLVYAVPVLIGLFWGAPLVTRELEAGAHRPLEPERPPRSLGAVKLGLLALAAMITVGLLSLMTSWWPVRSTARAAGRAQRARHQQARAAALRCDRHRADRLRRVRVRSRRLVGVLVRRTLPAMAVTLADLRGDPDLLARRRPAAPHPAGAVGPGAQHSQP